jgi:hypothetical protein
VKGIDTTQIIVAIINAAALVIVALIGWSKHRAEQADQTVTEGDRPPRDRKLRIVLWVCLILLACNLGLFAYRHLSSSQGTDVRIEYPADETDVAIEEISEGTSRNLPEGHKIWIVIFPHGTDRYYPQSIAASLQPNGEWSSRTRIGNEEDVRKQFDVIAFLLDEGAQDTFELYAKRSLEKNSWDGITALPGGAVAYDRVTVTRR